MIRECVCVPCVHPLSACQSGLKVVVYRTNMCILEPVNERCLQFSLSVALFLFRAPESRDQTSFSTFPLKHMKGKKKNSTSNTKAIFSSIVYRKNPTSKARINGRGGLLLWLSSWWLKGRCWVHYGMDLVLFQSEKTSVLQ